MTTVVNLRDFRGQPLPPDVVRICRPGPYGNPFRVADMGWVAIALGYHWDEAGKRRAAVDLYRAWMTGTPLTLRGSEPPTGGEFEYTDGTRAAVSDIVSGLGGVMARPILDGMKLPPRPDLEPLRGKRLACWCHPLPCHGDVIVELLEQPS